MLRRRLLVHPDPRSSLLHLDRELRRSRRTCPSLSTAGISSVLGQPPCQRLRADLYYSSGTCLSKTICLLDGHFNTIIHRLRQLARHGGRATHRHSERAEVILVDDGMLAEEQGNGWNQVSERG